MSRQPLSTQLFFVTTPGSNFTITSDPTWNNANNTVECIGAGGSGAAGKVTTASARIGGGSGGAYSLISNFTFATPGTTTATARVGLGGAAIDTTSTTQNALAGNAGGSTWFNSTTDPGVGADNTKCSAAGGLGGLASITTNQGTQAGGATTASWGTTKNAGGAAGSTTAGTSAAVSGGGGAGGPNGAGTASANATNGVTNGGQGDGASGGTGGASATGTAAQTAGSGNPGNEYGTSHGSGGGGGAARSTSTTGTTTALGGTGGAAGGGGGGAWHGSTAAAHATSGAGGNGLIRLQWVVNFPFSEQWGIVKGVTLATVAAPLPMALGLLTFVPPDTTTVLRSPLLTKTSPLPDSGSAQFEVQGSAQILLGGTAPVQSPFYLEDFSKAQPAKPSPQWQPPFNISLYPPPAVQAPFSLEDFSRPFTPRAAPPQQPQSRNPLIFSEVPFNQDIWPPINPVSRPPPQAQPYNPLIFSEVPVVPVDLSRGARFFAGLSPVIYPNIAINGAPPVAAPFAQYDWTKPYRTISAVPVTLPLNINLFTNPIPFLNVQSPGAVRLPTAPPTPTPNVPILDYASTPFSQDDWSKTAARTLAQPFNPYNVAIYTPVVAGTPFAQLDWSKPSRVSSVPPAPLPVNVNLFTNPIPFSQLDWSKPVRVPTVPGAPLPLNVNLFIAPAAPPPFVPIDWSKPFRVISAPPGSGPLNINLFTNPIPFAQFDWPIAHQVSRVRQDTPVYNPLIFSEVPFYQSAWPQGRPAPRGAPQAQPYNPGLYAAVPFTPIDWSVRRNRLPSRPLDVPNVALLAGFVPPPAPPFIPVDFQIPHRVRAIQPPAPTYNVAISLTLPPGPNYIARGDRRVMMAVGQSVRVATGEPRVMLSVGQQRNMVALGAARKFTVVGISNNVSQTNNLSPAIDETVEFPAVTFDFGLMLQSDVTITSIISVICAVVSGTDPNPSSRLSGGAVIVPSPNSGGLAQAVTQLVGGMIGGVEYRLQCVAQISDGQKLSLWAHVTCQTPN